MKPFHYVYRIDEIVTGEFYIGVRSCKCQIEDDPYLGSMRSWKPNKSNLRKTVLGTFASRKEANEFEAIMLEMFIDKEKYPMNRNYVNFPNWCTYGSHPKMPPRTIEHRKKLSERMKGRSLSEETKRKMRETTTGRKMPKSFSEAVSKALKGRVFSEEHKLKLREAFKNRKPVSDETRRKMSESGKKRPPRSEETRKKLSEALKGKKHTIEHVENWKKSRVNYVCSDETKRKMSESSKGQIVSEETRAKLSKSNKGKMRSEETKRRVSDGLRRYFANKKKQSA